MILNSDELKDIVINYSEESIQQCSIDLIPLLIKEVGDGGFISKGKTFPKEGKAIPLEDYEGVRAFKLVPGYYSVTFKEGCQIPNGIAGRVIGRSSSLRVGIKVDSGLYDPGFWTSNLGCFIIVNKEVFIEDGARLATFLAWRSKEGEIYSGQWQGL